MGREERRTPPFPVTLHSEHTVEGRPIIVDFSPVTDFREATCRQYEENTCNRGGYCNFMHLKRISRELRRQLFGRYRRRHSRSRSRSHSPYRHHSYEERSHGGRGSSKRYDERDYYHESQSRRHRTTSPGHRRGRSRSRSRSPGGRRNRSPIREGSEERRAKIEQWNREREQQQESANKVNNDGDNDSNYNGHMQNGDQYYGYQQQPPPQQEECGVQVVECSSRGQGLWMRRKVPATKLLASESRR